MSRERDELKGKLESMQEKTTFYQTVFERHMVQVAEEMYRSVNMHKAEAYALQVRLNQTQKELKSKADRV